MLFSVAEPTLWNLLWSLLNQQTVYYLFVFRYYRFGLYFILKIGYVLINTIVVVCCWIRIPEDVGGIQCYRIVLYVSGNDGAVRDTRHRGGQQRHKRGAMGEETRPGDGEQVSSTRSGRWRRPHHVRSWEHVQAVHSLHRQGEQVRSCWQVLAGNALAPTDCSFHVPPLVIIAKMTNVDNSIYV